MTRQGPLCGYTTPQQASRQASKHPSTQQQPSAPALETSGLHVTYHMPPETQPNTGMRNATPLNTLRPPCASAGVLAVAEQVCHSHIAGQQYGAHLFLTKLESRPPLLLLLLPPSASSLRPQRGIIGLRSLRPPLLLLALAAPAPAAAVDVDCAAVPALGCALLLVMPGGAPPLLLSCCRPNSPNQGARLRWPALEWV